MTWSFRLEFHRADVHAAAALDAVDFDGNVGIDGDQSVAALDDGYVQIIEHESHHGSAHLDLGELSAGPSAVFDQLLCTGADLYDEVSGVLYIFTGDGHDSLDERHTGTDCVRNGLYGADVADDASHIGGKSSAGHLTLHDSLDEHLFSALRILGPGNGHFDVIDAFDL